MGAGASSGLTEAQELRVFKHMKGILEEKLPPGTSVEENPKLYHELQQMFQKIIDEVREDDRAQPKEPKCIVTQHFTTSEDIVSLTIGDIVRAQPPDSAMFFEGVIMDKDSSSTPRYLVVFGDDDMEWITAEKIQKVLPADALEVGDRVQAKPLDEENFYEGIVQNIHFNHDKLFYDIAYSDCDDVDLMIPEERIRKLQSGRSASQHWKSAVRKIQAINLIKKAAMLSKN